MDRQPPSAATPGTSQDGGSRTRHGSRDLLVALAMVAVALLFRLPHLEQTPGWDGDEGYNLDLAWHLSQGRAQSFALAASFTQHPILSYALLAPLVALFGRELWVLRALSAVAGGLTAGLLYLAAAASGPRRVAVLAALAFAGTAFTVAYNRLGYTYNLLLFWTALTLYLVIQAERHPGPHGAGPHQGREAGRPARWLWGAAACAALGWLTDQEGIFLPLFVAWRAPAGNRLAVLAVGLAPAILAAVAMLAWQPAVALTDWAYSFTRLVSPGGTASADPAAGSSLVALATALATALARWVLNYFHLLGVEWWWPAAIAGLFSIRPLGARRRLLSLAGLMVVPIFALRELNPWFRTGIPLLLPAAWGLGSLMDAGIVAVYQTAGRSRRWLGAVLAAMVVALPLGLELGRSAGGLLIGFTLPFDWALTLPTEQEHARRAAAYVNGRTGPGDVVLVSPHVSWLYQAQVADFLQAVAAGGEAIAFYPAGLPRERFRFDPSPDNARYAVLDGYWDRWGAEAPAVARLMAHIQAWPLELQTGQYRVHRRPPGPPPQSSERLGMG
ncbi:MAG TPA: glycosyltransferase family 39 protein [Chloroflexota bacterium]|nr:glycosyltransferase family 39 protein [Chloroflexota bacterium]